MSSSYIVELRIVECSALYLEKEVGIARKGTPVQSWSNVVGYAEGRHGKHRERRVNTGDGGLATSIGKQRG